MISDEPKCLLDGQRFCFPLLHKKITINRQKSEHIPACGRQALRGNFSGGPACRRQGYGIVT